MKNRVKAVYVVLLLGACGTGAALFFGAGRRAQQDPVDLPALRVELRERVAEGGLTEAEARVRLAEAYAAAKQQERDKAGVTLLPELEALGADLKRKVRKGELTGEAAKAKWLEAIRQLTAEAKGEDSKQKAGLGATGGGTKGSEGSQ